MTVSFVIAAATACGQGPTTPPSDTDETSNPEPIPDSILAVAGATITAVDMTARVGVLADDSMMGRDTPSAGLESAATYIAGALAGAGVAAAGTDEYLQRWDYEYTLVDTASVVLETVAEGGPELKNGRDYFMMGSQKSNATGSVLWGGSATESPDAGGLSMTGRVVLYDLPGVSRFDLPAALTVGDIDGATQLGGAVAVGCVVPADFTEDEMARAVTLTRRWARGLPMFWIREPAARPLLSAMGADLDSLRSGGPQPVDGRLHVRGPLMPVKATPPNVVGLLRGSDPVLRDEYVVVSAHFDHLGTGPVDETGDSIYNGADDNASGTAAVLEVAQALASLPTAPARSVLFLLVSGEEKGLLGSSGYMADPTVPLSGIVADINMDMIGRNDPGQVIGVGKEYSTLGDTALALAGRVSVGLAIIDDPVPDEHLFNRSDQLEFACRNIPALLFTTGLHEDYHQASDELSRLDTDKAARVARLVFHLVAHVANAGRKPSWTSAGTSLVQGYKGCP